MSEHYYYVGPEYKQDRYEVFCDIIYSEVGKAIVEFMEREQFEPDDYKIYIVKPGNSQKIDTPIATSVVCFILGENQPNEGEDE